MYRYSAKDRADIAKYAGQNCLTSAASHFSRKFGMNVSKTTVKSIRGPYEPEVKEKGKEMKKVWQFFLVKKRKTRINQIQSYQEEFVMEVA